MIAASEPQEFVPNGRQHIKNHPGPVITSDQNQLKYDSFLAHRFSQVNLDDNLEGERWELRRAPDSHDGPLVEEELFIHGCTVVVSRGSVGHSLAFGQNDKSSGRKVIVTYTMEAPIKYALWVTFLDIRDNNYLPMPSLCIIDSDKISVYLEAGDEYTTPLQFKVASAWATKYGLLLERVSHCHTDGSPDPALTLTTLFSVIHPLHEISPILSIKQGGILTYMNDPCLKVIYTSTEPSLCLIFDVRTGYHSIWKIRRALPEECHWMCGQNSGITIQTSGHNNLSCSPGSAHLSASLRPTALNRSSAFMTGHSGSGSSSLFNKTNNSQGTLYHSTSPHSISFYRSHSAGNSPRLSPRQSPCGSSVSSIEARLGGSIAPQVTEPKPIVPELCLEYVWSETSSPSTMGMDIRNRAAGKAFLSRDTLGQDYLCYLVRSSTLTMVRLGYTNTKEPELIVGTVSQIIAKDAVPIPALDMIAVLETGGCVLLYTGTTPVGKVHIAGVSAQLSSSTYLTTISNVTRINSPFPKRSSLMSSTRLGDELFDDTSHVQSPGGGGGLYYHLFFDEAGFGTECHPRDSIQAVRDPVAARFTLEYSSGIMFRFTLPEFSSSPLVTECIKVLKSVLQKDIALLTMAKWYTIRNAPGTQDISPKQEWQLFISAILGLIGYQLDTLPLVEYYLTTDCDSPAKNCKKMRGSNLGSANDWNYLISSSFHENMNSQLGLTLGLHCDVKVHSNDVPKSKPDLSTFNTSSPLYSFMYLILFSFHLLYEEIKLEPVLYDGLPLLVKLLYQLSTDLRLNHYCQYYWRDFPHDCQINTIFISQLHENELVKLSKPQFMSDVPPSVFEHILCLVMGIQPQESYPCITGVNSKSRTIIEIIGILSDAKEEHLKSIVPPGSRSVSPQPTINLEPGTDIPTPAHKAVMFMAQRGLEREDLLNLPCGVGLILGEAIQTVTENPCQSWPDEVYRLISRSDLLPLSKATKPLNYKLPIPPTISSPPLDTNTRETDQMLQLRFSKDQRVNEVRRLLQSSEPVTIAITQRPEVSDHEFIEEQERHLYAICTRTMALPVGRGMMDLHTTEPVVTEQLNIPRLCLSGRAPPRGTSVELSHIEVVPNMNLWPLFHNGVAAGLRISPHAKNIESAWILFNKPKNGTDALPEHAGFVMALGLSGHLNNLMQIYLYNYLNKCHEMTSVGVLLGLAASKRGTMDIRATKLFSLHIESLLPPTSIELDLVQNIQVAALLGIGLVYQGTAHRHIAEALLSEIGRPPGPEMENSSDRECYSLAAGLGLGLVVLGRGNDPTGLADLDIADTLQYYMVGGHKRPLTGSQKEKYKSPSYQIREGDCVNNHVTGPGATLALGMMYFNTGNMAVAHWLEAPDSEYMLDFICPDQLLLRMIARGLVLWEHILPTKAWVEGHVPHTIRPYCLVKPRDNMDHVDLETVNQAYCNIIAGACMAVGLRFAGSANNQAFETLFYYCKLFTSISSKSIAELAGKSTIETCICVTLLSLAMVMAGTGDLEVMRLCRHLGSRLSQLTNSVVTYGSHLAVHMALGLLYLGGGALTLSTSPEAIAALICAFFPRFPTHSNDNRYHLQAFRHLYVLAVEHRLFLPRDIDTGQLCFAHIKVIFLDTPYYKNQEVTLFAPTLLPELHLLSEVRVQDDRYWPIVFTRGKNWHQLEELLSTMDSIGVKLRAGCLPYTDDPHGYKTLLAQTLSTETATSWAISASSILGFTSDKKMTNFTKYFLELCEKNAGSTDNELKLVQWLSNICYECVTRNKLPLLDFWIIILLDVMRAAGSAPCSTVMWQMKLVLAQGLKRVGNHHTSFEHFQAISQYLTAILDTWEQEHMEILSIYMKCGSVEASSAELMKLSSYLIFYGIPLQSHLTSFVDLKLPSVLQLANKLNQFRLQPTTIKKIWFLYNFNKEGNKPVT
uniref:Putative anaphase-promoting complex apc subunit 1 meiotic check point regulator/tsg24 n=2 Tax=Triatoma infestans TaxID=30076 RepID=A0A023F131_TRIIF